MVKKQQKTKAKLTLFIDKKHSAKEHLYKQQHGSTSIKMSGGDRIYCSEEAAHESGNKKTPTTFFVTVGDR
jgi:hypothetical protein